MATLVVVYLLGWAALAAYVAWLGVQNARLAGRLKEMQTRLEERQRAHRFYSKAA